MIMKKILIVLLLPLLLVSCQKAYTVKGNLVLIPCQDRTVRLQVISPEIVRVSVSPDGKFNDRQSLVVVPQEAFTAVLKYDDNK